MGPGERTRPGPVVRERSWVRGGWETSIGRCRRGREAAISLLNSEPQRSAKLRPICCSQLKTSPEALCSYTHLSPYLDSSPTSASSPPYPIPGSLSHPSLIPHLHLRPGFFPSTPVSSLPHLPAPDHGPLPIPASSQTWNPLPHFGPTPILASALTHLRAGSLTQSSAQRIAPAVSPPGPYP